MGPFSPDHPAVISGCQVDPCAQGPAEALIQTRSVREEKFKEAGQAEAPPDSPHPARGNGLEATLSPRRLHMLVSSVPVEDFEHARAGSPSFHCTLPIHVASVKTRRREQTLADPVTPHLQLRASDFLVKYVLPVSVAGTSSRSLPAREGCYY